MSPSLTLNARAKLESPLTSRNAVRASGTVSAPSTRPPTRSLDPYYGHEESAVLSARFITSLFHCPDIPAASATGTPTSTLAHFVAYALHRTRLPSIVTSAALLLLQRLKTKFPAARGASGHRLFISAFMIASKVICDETYSNQSWANAAQNMFALKEINQMESEMWVHLEWKLNVGGEEVLECEAKIRVQFGLRSNSRPKTPFNGTSSYSPGSCGASAIVTPTPSVCPIPDLTPSISESRASDTSYHLPNIYHVISRSDNAHTITLPLQHWVYHPHHLRSLVTYIFILLNLHVLFQPPQHFSLLPPLEVARHRSLSRHRRLMDSFYQKPTSATITWSHHGSLEVDAPFSAPTTPKAFQAHRRHPHSRPPSDYSHTCHAQEDECAPSTPQDSDSRQTS